MIDLLGMPVARLLAVFSLFITLRITIVELRIWASIRIGRGRERKQRKQSIPEGIVS